MSRAASPFRVGVISDTHGQLDESVFRHFASVQRIIHAGGIGSERLLWDLEQLAPVVAVRGQHEARTICLPTERMAVIAGRTFYVRHHFATVEQMNAAQQRIIEQHMPDVVVFGDGPQAYAGRWRGTLLFNPGSASAKGCNLQSSIGLIEIEDDQVTSRIIALHQ